MVSQIEREICMSVAIDFYNIEMQYQRYNQFCSKSNSSINKAIVREHITSDGFGTVLLKIATTMNDLQSLLKQENIPIIDVVKYLNSHSFIDEIPEDIITGISQRTIKIASDNQVQLPEVITYKQIPNISDYILGMDLTQDELVRNIIWVFITYLSGLRMELSNYQITPTTTVELKSEFKFVDIKLPQHLSERYNKAREYDKLAKVEDIMRIEKLNNGLMTVDYLDNNDNMASLIVEDIGSVIFIVNKYIRNLTTILHQNFKEVYSILLGSNIYYNLRELLYTKVPEMVQKPRYFLGDKIDNLITTSFIPNTITNTLCKKISDTEVLTISESDAQYVNLPEIVRVAKSIVDIEGVFDEGIYYIQIPIASLELSYLTKQTSQKHKNRILYNYNEILSMVKSQSISTLNALDASYSKGDYFRLNKLDMVSDTQSFIFTPTLFNIGDYKFPITSLIDSDIISHTPSKLLWGYRLELLEYLSPKLNQNEDYNMEALSKVFHLHRQEGRALISSRVSLLNNRLHELESLLVTYEEKCTPYIYNNLFNNSVVFKAKEFNSSIISSSTLTLPADLVSDLLNMVILNYKLHLRAFPNNLTDIDITTTHFTDDNLFCFGDLYGYDFSAISEKNKAIINLRPTNEVERMFLCIIIALVNNKFKISQGGNSMKNFGMSSTTLKDLCLDDGVLSKDWTSLGITNHQAELYVAYIGKILTYIEIENDNDLTALLQEDIAYHYAKFLLSSGILKDKSPIEVIFNNSNQGELLTEDSMEFIINGLEDLLSDVDISNTILVEVEGVSLAGALRDITNLTLMSTPLIRAGKKLLKDNSPDKVDKLLSKAFNNTLGGVNTYPTFDMFISGLIKNTVDNELHIYSENNFLKKIALSNEIDFLNTTFTDLLKDFIESNIRVGRFTHRTDIKTFLSVVLANSYNIVKSSKIMILNNRLLGTNNNDDTLIYKYFTTLYLSNLFDAISTCSPNSDVKFCVQEELSRIEEILYETSMTPNFDAGYEDYYLLSLITDEVKVDLDTVSFERLTEDLSVYNPFSKLNILSELYFTFLEYSLDTSTFSNILMNITGTFIYDEQLETLYNYLKETELYNNYGMFTYFTYLADTQLFNTIVDSNDVAKVNAVDEFLHKEELHSKLKELIRTLVAYTPEGLYQALFYELSGLDLDLRGFILFEKAPFHILFERQNALINRALQMEI